MKANLTVLAIVASVAAIFLAADPGRFAFAYVDAGGHSVRMLISGHGGPVVVFESGGTAGGGNPLECWELVQPAISKLTTTVSYDRAGCGLSEPGPKPRDARQVALELHTALHHSGLQPPYILVGHSFGGPLTRIFAGMYPKEVCGLVLADPTQEDFIMWNIAHQTNHVHDLPADWQEIKQSLDEVRMSRLPDGVRVVLITGMGPQTFPSFVTAKEIEEYRSGRQMWLKFHQEWVDNIPGARHIVTEKSGHDIPFQDPELLVNVISNMVVEVEADTGR